MRKVAAAQRGSSVPLFAPRYLSPCQINLPPVKLNDIYSRPRTRRLQYGNSWDQPAHSTRAVSSTRRLGKGGEPAGRLPASSGGESDDCLLGPRLIIMYNDSCQG